MAKTEDIEAKLAAYVDGDIDAAGRAEIEKHLASNPRHRELLTDLSRQRDLLRALPRDMAPADVAETINSQLERAVLLGDVDSGTDIAGTIGRWSQLRAIAAVLLLTGGLAGVIYYLLPFSNRHNSELADLRITPSPATSPAMVELATANPTPLDSDTRLLATSAAREAAAAPATAPAMADAMSRPQLAMNDDQTLNNSPGGFAAPDGGRFPGIASNSMTPRQEIFDNVVQSRAAQSRQTASPAAPGSVYVVSTDNPESTSRDLHEYLKNNNIVWESAAPEPMPQALDAGQQQTANATQRQQMPTVQFKTASEGQAAPSERIVARQVTRDQAVALQSWINQRQQSQAHKDEGLKDINTSQILTNSPNIPSASPEQAAAIAPTTSPAEVAPTTLPFALDIGLNAVLDFSPPRLDAPGVELNSHRAESLSISDEKNQLAAAPTTQTQQSILGDIPTTLPAMVANDRVDVVIVVEAQQSVIPATLPATSEPSEPIIAAPVQQP